MAAVARGKWSEALPALARKGIEVPLVTERSDPSFGNAPEILDGLEAEARRLAAMGLPFRRVFEVTRSTGAVTLVREHVVGLSGAQLVQGLIAQRRLLPLDVWLRLALCLTSVPEDAPCGPTAGGGLSSLGFDVRRQVRLFSDPLLDLVGFHLDDLLPPAPRVGVRLETLRSASPEAIKGMALTGASSVFAAASVLAELLTTTAPFLRATMMETLIAVVEGAPTWVSEAHPGVSRALREVLRRALQPRPGDRWESLAAFRQAVEAAVGLEAAPTERAATVCLSVAFPLVQLQLRALERAPDWLPEVWRAGGLEVLEDELLESLVPLDRFPARKG